MRSYFLRTRRPSVWIRDYEGCALSRKSTWLTTDVLFCSLRSAVTCTSHAHAHRTFLCYIGPSPWKISFLTQALYLRFYEGKLIQPNALSAAVLRYIYI